MNKPLCKPHLGLWFKSLISKGGTPDETPKQPKKKVCRLLNVGAILMKAAVSLFCSGLEGGGVLFVCSYLQAAA